MTFLVSAFEVDVLSICPADLNRDGIVNMQDLIFVSKAFHSYPGHAKWNPKADLNNDYVVNILDMVLLLKDIGMTWASYDFDEPPDWDVVSGTWSIVNGSLELWGNSEGLVYCRDLIWKDCEITARVKIATDSPQAEAAFCVRFVDSGNFYWAGLGCWGHRVSISRMVGHVPEELIFSGERAAVVKDVWYDVSIKVSSDAIMLYVDDVLELVVNDLTSTSGAVGVRAFDSHIFVDYATVSGFESTTIDQPIDQKFLSSFHTGVCLWDAFNSGNEPEYSTWQPARSAGVLKWGIAGQNLPGRGSRAWLEEDGDMTGAWTNSRVIGFIQKYFALDVVPVMEMNFENFETLTETHIRNLFTKIAGWIDDEDPNGFIIWNCGAELNFPDGQAGWNGYKIDYRDFNPQMKMIRKVRDELGLQSKILLSFHANLLKSYYTDATGVWHSQDWYTGFVGINEYIEGFAECDIAGFSMYMGYKDSSWRDIVEHAWERTRIIWQKVNDKAGRTLPCYFMEYSYGNVWKSQGRPIWKEAVTHTYTQLVKNNKWCKGVNWYIGWEIESDAMEELVKLGKMYDGYGG